MPSEVIVAILGLIGSLCGSLIGIIASSKLTQYRIQQLEDKVNKHNTIIERTYKLEGQMTECIHDICDLKSRLNKEA